MASATVFPRKGARPHLQRVPRVKGTPELTEKLLAAKAAVTSLDFQLVATKESGPGWERLNLLELRRAALTAFAAALQDGMDTYAATDDALAPAEKAAVDAALASDWATAAPASQATDPAQLTVDARVVPKYNASGQATLMLYEFTISFPAVLRRMVLARLLYDSAGHLLLRPTGFSQPLLASLLCPGDALPRHSNIPQACMLVSAACPDLPLLQPADLLAMFSLDTHAQVLWTGLAAPQADGTCLVTQVARRTEALAVLGTGSRLAFAITGTDIPLPGLQVPPHGYVALIAGGRHLLPQPKRPGQPGSSGGFVYVAEEHGLETELHVRVARIPTRVATGHPAPPAPPAGPAGRAPDPPSAQPMQVDARPSPPHPLLAQLRQASSAAAVGSTAAMPAPAAGAAAAARAAVGASAAGAAAAPMQTAFLAPKRPSEPPPRAATPAAKIVRCASPELTAPRLGVAAGASPPAAPRGHG